MKPSPSEHASRRTIRPLVLAATLLASIAPGCDKEEPPRLATCSQNSDCAEPNVCALGQCRAKCKTSRDCADDQWCITDPESQATACVDRDRPCAKQRDCTAPLACATDYRCRNLCDTDDDCNVLGVSGRVCARDDNDIRFCADPGEETDGRITSTPPPGADTSKGVTAPPGVAPDPSETGGMGGSGGASGKATATGGAVGSMGGTLGATGGAATAGTTGKAFGGSAVVGELGGESGVGGSPAVSCSGVGTNIAGILASNQQTWTPGASPYFIKANTLVNTGAKLSIEPGTEVRFCGDFSLEVRGELQALGTAESPIVFRGADIYVNGAKGQLSFAADGSYLRGSRFEHVDLSDGGLRGQPLYMKDSNLGRLASSNGFYAEKCDISILGDAFASSWFRNSRLGTATIDGRGGGLLLEHCAVDTLALEFGAPENVVTLNTIGTLTWASNRGMALHDNSIHDGGDQPYAVRVLNGGASLDATRNYWGPALTAEMSSGSAANISGIYDFYDDFSLGEVVYTNFLSQPPSGVGTSATTIPSVWAPSGAGGEGGAPGDPGAAGGAAGAAN